jgi:hypothetical protein
MDNLYDLAGAKFINARERFAPPKKSLEPKVDNLVSKIVGKKIFTLDPRLLKLIVKWKGNKPQDSLEPDNFLNDPKKVQELKEVLGN